MQPAVADFAALGTRSYFQASAPLPAVDVNLPTTFWDEKAFGRWLGLAPSAVVEYFALLIAVHIVTYALYRLHNAKNREALNAARGLASCVLHPDHPFPFLAHRSLRLLRPPPVLPNRRPR